MSGPSSITSPGPAGRPAATAVPLVDLWPQNEVIVEQVLAAISEHVRRGDLMLGDSVEEVERALAASYRVAHAVGVANGTDALELALRAVGVRPGDEVVLPANTFIATAEAVERAGGHVVLVDCDATHLLIDPARVAATATRRTRAVIAVHLYGQAAPVEGLRAVMHPDIAVVGDAAQAQGATRHGRSVMALGDVAATSFYPTKNLGAWGDAGAVLTGRADVAERIRSLRNHGSQIKHEHTILGTNSRLDTVQALVLHAKLPHLESWNTQRCDAAARYDELLEGIEAVTRPQVAPGNRHVWHLYAIRVPADRRDAVIKELARAGVGTGIHYRAPIHLHGAFTHLGHGPGAFPVAEAASRELLSLPLFPGISAEQQERVVHRLIEAL